LNIDEGESMSWAAGYNNSVAYTTGFYQEQSPTWLKAALVMQRIAPPADGKFTYCELGFGQGLTSLILAATHPEGEFYACDFNPVHVVAASSIRDDAKLSNLTLLENSFGQLADGEADLPMFDFVTMHGIVSWVSDETRAQIVRFLARYLKPGGVVQISYNAMAACAQVQPLQRLLTTHAKNRGENWAGAAAFAQQLVEHGAQHFLRNPDAAAASIRSRALIRAISCTSTCTSSGRRSTSRTSRRNSPTPSSCSPAARAMCSCRRWRGSRTSRTK